MNHPLLLFSFCVTTVFSCAQPSPQDYGTVDAARWVIPKDDTLDYSCDTYEGQTALLLKRKILNPRSASIAYPKEVDFTDGIIELDLASPAGGAGFLGLAFRIRDAHHYETVYFRPGYSKTMDAVQYMPAKQAQFNWWDYTDKKYQAKAVLPLKDWFHVKAVVKGQALKVYVNRQPLPVYETSGLDTGLSHGAVGFWLGNSPVGAYKNLIIQKM